MNRVTTLAPIALCLCMIVCCSCGVIPPMAGRVVPQDNVRWAVPFDGSASQPAVADGAIFIGSMDGCVYCFNARTGVERWRLQTGEGRTSGPFTITAESNDPQNMLSAASGWAARSNRPKREVKAAPTVADGTVYVGSMDHSFYAIDAATGQLKWSTPLAMYVWDGAEVSDGVVVVMGESMGVRRPGRSVLFVLDAESGAVKWSTDLDSAVTLPEVRDGIVYCSLKRDQDFSLAAFDLHSGERLWSTDCEGSEPGKPFVRSGLILTYAHLRVSPETNPESSVITPPYVTAIYAFERSSGAVRWLYRAPEGDETSGRVYPKTHSMPVDGERVYLSSAEGVYALDMETGRRVWRIDGNFSARSLYLGEHVYVGGGSGSNEILAIDPESGGKIWERSSPWYMQFWEVLGDRIIAYAGNERLYGLSPADGSTIWTFKNNGALLHSDPVELNGGIIFSTRSQIIMGGGGAQGYLISFLPPAS